MNSKDFDARLQLDNFRELEQNYQDAKKFFLHLKEKIRCDEVEARFPAFCCGEKQLRIKYPTYSVRIINEHITYTKLKELLSGQENIFISQEANVVGIPDLKPVIAWSICCLRTSLPENERLAEQIEKILESHGLVSERCVASGHYTIPIDVDNDGYIIIPNRHFSE